MKQALATYVVQPACDFGRWLGGFNVSLYVLADHVEAWFYAYWPGSLT